MGWIWTNKITPGLGLLVHPVLQTRAYIVMCVCVSFRAPNRKMDLIYWLPPSDLFHPSFAPRSISSGSINRILPITGGLCVCAQRLYSKSYCATDAKQDAAQIENRVAWPYMLCCVYYEYVLHSSTRDTTTRWNRFGKCRARVRYITSAAKAV